MIFIVVKFTVRPEFSDTWLDRVERVHRGHARRAREPLVRMVAQC